MKKEVARVGEAVQEVVSSAGFDDHRGFGGLSGMEASECRRHTPIRENGSGYRPVRSGFPHRFRRSAAITTRVEEMLAR